MSAQVERNGKMVRPHFNYREEINYDSVRAQMAESSRNLLEDVVAELREIRISLSALRCNNFLAIPHKLDAIEQNTKKPMRKKATKR